MVYPFKAPRGPYYLRRPPALYGDGLLEAVPDEEVVRVGNDEATRTPNHRGRIARLTDGTIGRFGWKANVATLRDFVSTAFATELGISPAERERDVREVTAFVDSLAAPPQDGSQSSQTGRELFGSIGCADCHRPALRLGSYAPHPSLGGTVIAAYTDLLLHDMGPTDEELSDGAATAREFRTPPLWGVAATGPRYLHDGSARSLEEAIARHGGQAADAARRFRELSPADRTAMMRFLRSL